ncbi:hypothetical protein [Estrella lausannensis]|uniref:Putative membrane protein n=1 Tax=Estrella lausannensis TaxID=483423 RepID=A0A0H5E7X2_9BACT|nr:hypothetical protein [Estrella lausannensis]CRX39435.1 putative membrane protein [Estrella lausannensis]
MSTPIGSRSTPPPEQSGFVESLKKGAENFKKISLFEKVLTVTATVFASIPTLFIGGFFAFIACSNYFANRNVQQVDIKGGGAKTPTSENAFKADKAARETLNGPIVKPETGINIQEEAKKLAGRLGSLQTQVDKIDLDSPKAIQTIFKLREGVEKEKQLLTALKSKGDLGEGAKEAVAALSKLESALSGQEEKLLYKAGLQNAGGDMRASNTGADKALALPKEIERIQQALALVDRKVDDLAAVSEDKFAKIAALNEELDKERPALLNAFTKLKESYPEEANKLAQLMASVESKLQEQQESFTKELLLSTSEIVAQVEEKKLNADFVLIDSRVDNVSFDSIEDLQEVLALYTEVAGRRETMEKILSYSSLDSKVKAEIVEDLKELKEIEGKLNEKVKVNSELIKETLQEGVEKAKLGLKGGKEGKTALLVTDKFVEAFGRELSAGLNQIAKSEMGALLQVVKKETEALKTKGISNIGNSCYMNSSLQALLSVPSFKEKIMSEKWPAFGQLKDEMAVRAASKQKWELIQDFVGYFNEWEAMDPKNLPKDALSKILRDKSNKDEIDLIRSAYKKYFVLKNLQSTLQEFSTALDQSKNPSDMKPYAYALRKAIFDTGIYGSNLSKLTGQHDAAQLIGMINEVIGYQITYQTIRSVPDQGIKKVKNEPMGTLQIPILKKPKGDRTPIKFQELCDHVFKTTEIDDPNNALKVEEDGQAAKFYGQYQEKIQIGGPPPENLVLQLKRFEWFNPELGGAKITDLVELPKDHIINMSSAFENAGEKNVRYKVVAAVHHGGGLGGGHYTPYVDKGDGQPANEDWQVANDSSTYKPANIGHELGDSYVFILQRVS